MEEGLHPPKSEPFLHDVRTGITNSKRIEGSILAARGMLVRWDQEKSDTATLTW